MSAKISDLQERQIVNIADGKCLGNIKDIELNVREGTIQALVLPATGGFLAMLQNQGELLIPWQKVVRIGVDVVLIDMPELAEPSPPERGRGLAAGGATVSAGITAEQYYCTAAGGSHTIVGACQIKKENPLRLL